MTYSLMYSSAAAFPLDDTEVHALLGECRQRNTADGVTGVLLYIRLDYHNAAFLQVLEGREDVVEDTYRRIARDELHKNLAVLSRGPVPAPRFGQWAMKFVEIDHTALPVVGDQAPAQIDELLRDRAAMNAVLDRHGFDHGC